MIQRIQTVFFLLAVVAWVLVLFVPIAVFYFGGESIPYVVSKFGPAAGTLPGVADGMNGVLLFALAIFVLILSVLAIFNYKKRLLQLKLGKINLLMHLVFIVVAFFFVDGIKGAAIPDSFGYCIGMALPVVSIVLIIFANRAITKDEQMVRAADRIR